MPTSSCPVSTPSVWCPAGWDATPPSTSSWARLWCTPRRRSLSRAASSSSTTPTVRSLSPPSPPPPLCRALAHRENKSSLPRLPAVSAVSFLHFCIFATLPLATANNPHLTLPFIFFSVSVSVCLIFFIFHSSFLPYFSLSQLFVLCSSSDKHFVLPFCFVVIFCLRPHLPSSLYHHLIVSHLQPRLITPCSLPPLLPPLPSQPPPPLLSFISQFTLHLLSSSLTPKHAGDFFTPIDSCHTSPAFFFSLTVSLCFSVYLSPPLFGDEKTFFR